MSRNIYNQELHDKKQEIEFIFRNQILIENDEVINSINKVAYHGLYNAIEDYLRQAGIVNINNFMGIPNALSEAFSKYPHQTNSSKSARPVVESTGEDISHMGRNQLQTYVSYLINGLNNVSSMEEARMIKEENERQLTERLVPIETKLDFSRNIENFIYYLNLEYRGRITREMQEEIKTITQGIMKTVSVYPIESQQFIFDNLLGRLKDYAELAIYTLEQDLKKMETEQVIPETEKTQPFI